MYQIKDDDGKNIYRYEPVWVKKLSNGKYGLCEKKDAEGFADGGKVFPLDRVSYISQEKYDKKIADEQEEKITALEMAIAELSIFIADKFA